MRCLFQYQGQTLGGDPVSGMVADTSARWAKFALRQRGLTITSIDPVDTRAAGRPLPWRTLAALNQRLVNALEQGFPAAEAVRAFAADPANRRWKDKLEKLGQQLEAGASWAETKILYPIGHWPIIVQLFSGEQDAASLIRAFRSLQAYTSRMAERTRAWWGMITAANLLILLLLIFGLTCLAGFHEIFAPWRGKLPWPTEVALFLVDSAASEITPFILLFAVLAYLISKHERAAPFRLLLDSFKLSAPVFRRTYGSFAEEGLCRVLAMLYEARVEPAEGLHLAMSATESPALRKATREAMALAANGLDPALALLATGRFRLGHCWTLLNGQREKLPDGGFGQIALSHARMNRSAAPTAAVVLSYLVVLGILAMACFAMFLPIINLAWIVS